MLTELEQEGEGMIPMSLVLYWIHVRFGVEEAGLGGISLGFNFLTGISAPLSVWVARRIGFWTVQRSGASRRVTCAG